MIVKVCVVFVIVCTLLKRTEGIIGADLIKIEDYSYNVFVSFKEDGGDYHSGSIIHKRFILTSSRGFMKVTWNADHSSVKSVRLQNVHEVEVHTLTNNYPDSASPKNRIIEKVKAVYFRRDWLKQNKIRGSAAVLELQNDLDISRGNIQILKLPTTGPNYMRDYEKYAVFTGFGRNQMENEYLSGLRSMEVNIVDCPKTWSEFGGSSDFCGHAIILHKNIKNSQDQPLGAWLGDIGGPLVSRKNTIIGILDYFGNGDSRLGQNHPEFFTDISHHLDFINNVISGRVKFNDKNIKLIYTIY